VGVTLTISCSSAAFVAAEDFTWSGIGGRVGRLKAVAVGMAALTAAATVVATGFSIGWATIGWRTAGMAWPAMSTSPEAMVAVDDSRGGCSLRTTVVAVVADAAVASSRSSSSSACACALSMLAPFAPASS